MSLKGLYQPEDEKTVGTWRNTKAATGIYTFQHAVGQWLFFSKGTEITPAKFPGWNIDGWIIEAFTEKNKNSSSHHSINLVFDKRNGIDKFWSEFIFLSDYCPSEKKLIRGGEEIDIPLCIKTEGAYSKLQVINPITGEIEFTSKSFYKKNAKEFYETNEEFHKWFDLAVDYSCKERISKGLLKIDMTKYENLETHNEVILTEDISDKTSEMLITEDKPKSKRGRKKKEESLTEDENQIIEE